MTDYPSIFQIASNSDLTVQQNRERNKWNLILRRTLHDWEIENMVRLLASLHSSINNLTPDQFRWGDTDKKEFSVKVAYKMLGPQNTITENWPWKLIWKIKLPPKISCFGWTALHKACLTRDNLNKRKFHLTNRCYRCLKDSKSYSHLLLHCKVASDLQCMFISLFGLRWVMP